MIPRRVAYVVSTFPKISETFISGEIAEVCRRGVDVRILALKRPDDTLVHGSVHEAGLLDRTTYGAPCFADVLDGFQPDLVHAHFATDPTAVARHIASQRGIPFTFTAHGYDVYRRPPADLFARVDSAAAVVTVSEANRQHLATSCGGRAQRIAVIRCGVDTNWFTPGRPDPAPPLVVCVARLSDVKQLDLLLRACAIVRGHGIAFRCVIVGEGPERPHLESLRHQLAMDHLVVMPGAADQADVRRWWQRASIAVLSSRSEGMPVSLMEAASCAVPAVAPAVGGIPELVSHGVTGLVPPAGDVDAFADALEHLLLNEPLRAAMGSAARRRAEQHFSRVVQVDQLLRLWSSALN